MDIATWLVAVPWRDSFIGAFSGEFQNLRSDASSENEPAPSTRQQASCLPRPPWPPQHRALRRRIWRSLRFVLAT